MKTMVKLLVLGGGLLLYRHSAMNPVLRLLPPVTEQGATRDLPALP